MSLDFALIKDAIAHSAQRLKTVEIVAPGLGWLDDFFEPQLLNKLLQRLNLPLNWQSETIEDGSAAYPNRLKINWEAESIIEEIHTVLSELTPEINRVFQTQYSFQNITIWKDFPGYSIGWHHDNPSIALALQIYLSSGADLGTEFVYENQSFQAKYQLNSGYIMNNNPGLQHSMTRPVPENHCRTSIYGIWIK